MNERVVVSNGEAFDCSFLLGQAQVARGASLDDVPAAVAAWLVARVPVRALAASAAGVELERHADVLETDSARWHWLHLLDRIADQDDVLAPQRDLVEALTAGPVATSFYSYSSLSWLCFSASSHHPWVDEGLPSVVRASHDAYVVGKQHQEGRTTCDLERAVQLIERGRAGRSCASWPTLDEACRAITLYCDGASVEDVLRSVPPARK